MATLTKPRQATSTRFMPSYAPRPQYTSRPQPLPRVASKVVVQDEAEYEEEEKFDLYARLDSALADVRLMLDGKRKKKTLDELIEELLEEQKNELRNSND